MYMMRRIIGLCLLLVLSQSLFGQQKMYSSEVYRMGEEGYNTFRIPAIILGSDGKTLLAFAEARKNSRSDTGDIDLVLKRSEDGGRTWGKMIKVWNDVENVCGNPAPIVDRRSGKIILLATWNLGADHEKDILRNRATDTRRVFVLTSADNGIHWSEAKEITSSVKLPGWTWYATGPCHAIQLEKGKHKGRIVVPCDHAYLKDTVTVYRSHLIYSDDGGKHWKLGAISADDGNESTVAELNDGRLLLNMRTSGESRKLQKCRLLAFSADGGSGLADTRPEPQLTEPVCQGSMLSFRTERAKESLLLFSNPNATDKRKDLSVRVSKDMGANWERLFQVCSGPSAYSDLVQFSGNLLGVIYETGDLKPSERISFDVFNLQGIK